MKRTPSSPQQHFHMLLLTVVGQAFSAAGYALEDRPAQHAAGLFRFRRTLPDGLHGVIDFQLLAYHDTEWSSGAPSRFRVTLTRTDQANPAAPSVHPRFARRDLAALVVADFGVPILPGPDHWWPFRDTGSLGHALGEAGSLAIGYGMPWLSGELLPPPADQ